MKWIYIHITAIIIFTALLSSDAATVFSGEDNSLRLYNYLSEELMKEPAGINSPVYIKKLLMLSSAAGRGRTVELFREALKKLEDSGKSGSVSSMLMKLSLEEMESGAENRISLFKGIDRWSLSGPWQRYGAPDIDYSFLPELKSDTVRSRMQKIAAADWRIFPFGFIPERRGIVYAKTSFASGVPLKFWIISNAEYKFFVNGKEIFYCEKVEGSSVSGVTVKGTDGYTLLMKIADSNNSGDSYFRVIITDIDNRPLQMDFTDRDFNGSFFSEREYAESEVKFSPGFDGAEQTAELRELVKTGNLEGACTLGKKIVTQYPFYIDAYSELIPLLDRMKLDSEFAASINSFRKNFPESDCPLKWEAEFYRTRDAVHFAEIMPKLHSSFLSNECIADYLRYLAGRGDCVGALRFSGKFRDTPSLRGVVSETVRICSGNDAWRKYLIGMIASSGDPFFYYQMGLADMQAGLDPVLYWEKGLNISGSMREMREMADIYENGMLKEHGFYIGKFTDFYPEFAWNGVKRKATIRIFENGNFMTECEDIIPGALINEERFRLAPLKNRKILYVVKAKGGIAESAAYEELSETSGVSSIKLKDKSGADFVVVKYTGYSGFEKYPFYIARDLIFKGEDEKISELELEVLSYGSVKPAVSFMEKILDGEGDDSGALKFSATERSSYNESGKASLSIKMFSSDREFAAWYGGLLKLRQSDAAMPVYSDLKGETLKKTLDNIKKYITENFKNDGAGNFIPGKIEKIFAEKHGTPEELTLLAAAILENIGVRSFPAFIRDKNEFCGDNTYIALYIPDLKGKGYWLNFNNGIPEIKNSEALIIKGGSFEIMPAVQEGGEK